MVKSISTRLKVAQLTPRILRNSLTKTPKGEFIVGHSESGHHHLLEAGGVTLLEREQNGMKILHAILKNPVALKQDAGNPHDQQTIEAGEYIIGSSLEYDPFTQQARRVAD